MFGLIKKLFMGLLISIVNASVDYRASDTSNTINIHKHLMKKPDIK